MFSTELLQTELPNELSTHIDVVSPVEICQIINGADLTVAPAVRACIPEVAKAIDQITGRVRQGGRVVYIGAGTSGRLGILDASEIPPTFSAPYSQFIALIAGGDGAIRRAVEGAEDSSIQPIHDLNALTPPLNSSDTLIGIATSGRTPYVLAGLAYCRSHLEMFTVGISCVTPSEMKDSVDCLIECVVGPEVVTGSTRMKAGTATKLILNMISTGVMIRVGKTYGNLMVDVKTANNKLVDRARRIFKTLIPHTRLHDPEIDQLIASCEGSVKLALVVEKFGCSSQDARHRLDRAGGVLKKAWSLNMPDSNVTLQPFHPSQMVLCVDAGGTKCSVVIATKDGIQARAEGGPCNFVTLGHDAALDTISAMVIRATSLLPTHLLLPGSHVSLPLPYPLFAAAWLGGAGLDRPADVSSIHARVLALLALSDPSAVLITNDAALLSSAILVEDNNVKDDETKTGVVLITGTGSIAYSFRIASAERRVLVTPLERAGGWGYLLGDEGSAYSIGREAVRRALRHRDLGCPATEFHKSVARHFGCDTIGGIISAVYAPNQFHEREDAIRMDTDPKLRIATLSHVVFDAAFPAPPQEPSEEALQIVNVAVEAVVDVMTPLLQADRNSATLVMGGALAQIPQYRDLVMQELRKQESAFGRVRVVPDAAGSAVELLVRNFLSTSA